MRVRARGGSTGIAQRDIQIDARSLDGRNETEQECRQHGDEEGEEQYSRIDADVVQPRYVRQMNGREPASQKESQQKAAGRAE